MLRSILVATLIGMSVSASVSGPSELATLRARLDALTVRRAALRARIASLEVSLDKAHALGTITALETRPLARPTNADPMVLKGSFEVRDRMGKVIVHIGARGGLGRGLFVFNERERLASQAALSGSGGGALVVFDGRGAATGGSSHAGIFYTNEGPMFRATKPDGTSLADIDYLGFQFYVNGEMPAAMLEGQTGDHGGLMLADAAGRVMVSAGQWPGHPGYGLVSVGDGRIPPPLPVAGAFARPTSFIRGRSK